MKLHNLFALSGLAVLAAVAPAHAVVQYQTVGPVNFSYTNPGPGVPATFTFPAFSAAASTALIDVKLTGPTATSATMLSYGGTLTVGQFDTTPRTYTATSSPSFKFNNGGASTFTGSMDNVPLSGNPVSAIGTTPLTASGMYAGSFNTINATGNTVLQNYFAGNPTIMFYAANFNSTPPAGGGIFGNTLTMSSSDLYLTYSYEDGKPASVPGPLPIVGASLAFGFSRKLRRRIQSSVS